MRWLITHLAWIMAIGAGATLASAQPACDAVPTFAGELTPVREIHVAPPPLGSNQTGDGSAARPYAAIGSAWPAPRRGPRCGFTRAPTRAERS